jgi:hypothetical protein
MTEMEALGVMAGISWKSTLEARDRLLPRKDEPAVAVRQTEPRVLGLGMGKGAAGVVLLLACSFCGGHDESVAPSADGGLDGGQAVRWQDLYASYFGLAGQASCSQLPGSCHRAGSDLGVPTSGFVCGITSDACWQGMTQSANGQTPLVPEGGAPDATKTSLWAALYKGAPAGGAVRNNMPQNLSYTFSPSDLARIQAWIESGAPNN